MLGGNQSDEITFLSRSATSDLKGFYVPVKYEDIVKKKLNLVLFSLNTIITKLMLNMVFLLMMGSQELDNLMEFSV